MGAWQMKCPLIVVLLSSLSAFADGGEGRVIHREGSSLVFDETGALIIAANDTAVSRFTYDGHRVTRAETLVGEEVFDVAWLRDAGGLVTNIDYGCGYSVARTYDDAGRLAAIRDSFGHEWTFDFVEDFSAAEAHDGNGALTNILADGASAFNASYSTGRLVSLGTNGWHCAYDALGNRVRMGDRIFLPDYDDPLKRPLIECAADGSVIRRYLWGPTVLLGFIDADGALTVAHSDEQGSVIALTDIDGNVLFCANYGPYGEDWGSSGSNPTPFFWLGGLGVMKANPDSLIPSPSSLIPSPSSLYLTRHRLYSPVLRRFLSADPLGFAGGANLYAYADGNPLAYVDPLGLCAEDGEFGFLESLALGAAMGDFADDTGVGGTVGQIGVGLIPIAGQIADARDTAANFVNVWNNPSSGDAWIGLAMSGVAWVPGAGDAVKAAYKGGKQVAKSGRHVIGTGSSIVRSSGPVSRHLLKLVQ